MVIQMLASNLKQKTVALRQQHILEAAIHVFEAQGYRGATIKRIAHEAGVSDGTIYNVFENKEALLFGVLESLLRGTQSAPPPLPMEQLNKGVVFEQAIAARWRQMTPETLSMMRIILAEALTDRTLAKRYFETIIAPAISGLADVIGANALYSGFQQENGPLAQRAVVAAFLGFALLKLLGDDVLEDRMADVPAFLATFLARGLSEGASRGIADD